MTSTAETGGHGAPAFSAALILAAFGIVFGDIGTSPLYAFKIALAVAAGDHHPSRPDILGVLSLMLWTLALVVTVKYVLLVLRADNRGEGGILSLLALLDPKGREGGRRRGAVIVLGLAGAAFLFGDGAITPAISVLSAVEGLEVAAPQLHHWVVPITCLILMALFAIQCTGTARIGRLFGPVMVIWFIVLAGMGIAWIAAAPDVLNAFNPYWAMNLIASRPTMAFALMGAVFLTVTGTEALYADMGHVGRDNIRAAWFALVWPALSLNYLGQGALVLGTPEAAENPFFLMAPGAMSLPLVLLSTAATIIASQALISGVFSLTRQAIQLNFLPRVEIRQTSQSEYGQIYVPAINWLMASATLTLVLAFGSSENLAAAYGIAVACTELITAVLLFRVMIERWSWSLRTACAAMIPFVAIDLTFVASNALKIPEGGWLPMLGGSLILAMMLTWNRGSRALRAHLDRMTEPQSLFGDQIEKDETLRIPGTAVFLTKSRDGIPAMLLHYARTTHTLHKRVLIVTIETVERPRVSGRERVALAENLGHGLQRIVLRYGYMQTPNIPAALANLGERLDQDYSEAVYFLGHETVVLAPECDPGLRVYGALSRLAARSSDWFRLPADRVMEVGLRIELECRRDRRVA